MKKSKFDSTSLRAILIIIFTLMLAGLVGGFYYAQNWFNEMAVSINKTSAELAKNDNIQAQSNLQNELANLKPIKLKAGGLLSSSSNYQNTVSTDLSRYASNTGIQINDVSPTRLPIGALVSNVIGVQAKYVKVTLENPVPFNNLIKFLKAIETNIPKISLTGITLTHNSGMGGSVSVDPLILEVYTK
jgi:hypothetical protein